MNVRHRQEKPGPLHSHPPDIRVGDHLFVRQQTADTTCREKMRRESANRVDEPGDVGLGVRGVGGDDAEGSDVGVRGMVWT